MTKKPEMFYSIEFRIKDECGKMPSNIGPGAITYQTNGHIENNK
jgi:hypothetical protein